MEHGKLIVIDGSDGSGKATQTAILVERLRADGIRTETMDFPRYEQNIIGKLIGECIAGERGDFLHSDPYVASVLYAADRFEAKKQIETWLAEGAVVVLDRYVSANQIHQGGKIADENKRVEFLRWLDRLEYDVFTLPRPDLTIYLHMPTDLSIILLKEQHARNKKGSYLKDGKKDTLEFDPSYLEHAQMSAAWLMKQQHDWHRIECSHEGIIRSREDIAGEVYSIISQRL